MAHAIVCILDPMDVIGWGSSFTWDRFVMCLRGHYENMDHGLWEFAHFANTCSDDNTFVPYAINFLACLIFSLLLPQANGGCTCVDFEITHPIDGLF